MAKKGGFTLILGEPWEGKLADFCAAYYGADKTKVIREALDHYIDVILDKEPERKKRVGEERSKRIALIERSVKLVKPVIGNGEK